jgi:hypothetical protein
MDRRNQAAPARIIARKERGLNRGAIFSSLPISEWKKRFEDKFIPEPSSGCWLWLGTACGRLYGSMGVRGNFIKATHVSLMLDGRHVPIGMGALHHCDNPACVNPEHLYVGDQTDNNRDASKRWRRGMKKETVKNIQLALSEDATRGRFTRISESFSVTKYVVSDIAHGKRWTSW